jgi:hypothetical protein
LLAAAVIVMVKVNGPLVPLAFVALRTTVSDIVFVGVPVI